MFPSVRKPLPTGNRVYNLYNYKREHNFERQRAQATPGQANVPVCGDTGNMANSLCLLTEMSSRQEGNKEKSG